MSDESPFRAGVVAVWAKDPARGGVLEHVRVQRLGARAFLVGKLADDGLGQDPRAGATFWFAVDDVIMLTVYPDLNSARAAFAAQEKPSDGNGPRPSRWPWRS